MPKDKNTKSKPVLEESIEVQRGEDGKDSIRIKGSGAAMQAEKAARLQSQRKQESGRDISGEVMKAAAIVTHVVAAAHPPFLLPAAIILASTAANKAFDMSNSKDRSREESISQAVDESLAVAVISNGVTEVADQMIPGGGAAVGITADYISETAVKQVKRSSDKIAMSQGKERVMGSHTQRLQDKNNKNTVSRSNFL